MNSQEIPKLSIYKAVGYTLLLVVMAFPTALAGLQALNFVLGNFNP